jgi:spore maturation protein CgeB
MVDKAKYYLNKPDDVYKISIAGHRRAIQEHTWEKRFKELINHIESNYL